MKKHCAVMISLALLLSLAACGAPSRTAPVQVAPAMRETVQESAETKAEETTAAPASEAGTVTETESGTEAEAVTEAIAEAEAGAAGQEASSEETKAALETESSAPQEETSGAAADTATAGTVPLALSITEYIREYPGTPLSELKFVSDTELLSLDSEGFEELKASLEAQNKLWKDSTDAAFASQAREFSSGDINDYLKDLLPFSHSRGIQVQRTDSAVLSFFTSLYEWYGGAHPLTTVAGYSYDPVSGKALELGDMVTDYDALYEEVTRLLEEYPDSEYFFDDWKETLKDLFYGDPSVKPNWWADEDGIVLWFNQYQIAAYALGPVCIELGASDYPDLIRQEYFPGDIPLAEGTRENTDTIWVDDLCRKEGDYTDPFGYNEHYFLRLPMIYGADTEDIKKVNAEIEELKTEYVDTALNEIEDELSLSIRDIGYSFVTFKGITSVLVYINWADSDYTIYRCWNLDSDGRLVENAEVLALFGFDPESFIETAGAMVEEDFPLDAEWFDEDTRRAFKEIRDKTMSDENFNADVPLYITQDRGLGFVLRVYSMAGADYYWRLYSVPGTEHRADGLHRISINPHDPDNYKLMDGFYEISGGSGDIYRFDQDTVIIEGVPCYDDGCDPMTWVARYLEHPSYGVWDESDPYSCYGIAGGDILTVLVDDENRIRVLESITYWD